MTNDTGLRLPIASAASFRRRGADQRFIPSTAEALDFVTGGFYRKPWRMPSVLTAIYRRIIDRYFA
jgi:hypothetical protein